MIRVLHILGSLDRGGIETLLMRIYREIDRTKIQFDFLTHSSKEGAYTKEVLKLGGRVFSVPSRRDGIMKNRKALNSFFTEHTDYKIVHMHLSSLSYVTPLKIAKKHEIPNRIVHSHNVRQGGSSLHKYIHYYNQIFVKKTATEYFACSELAALWLYGGRNYKRGIYQVIKNAINVEDFEFDQGARTETRKKLNIEDNQLVIGHIGRFHPQKNHSFLLSIMQELIKTKPNALLLLVGDGQERQNIEEQIQRLNLKNNVKLLGVRSDIERLINSFDLFLLPSLYEGLGIVLVEAQANGIPVIASRNGIPEEVNITDCFHFLDLNDDVKVWTSLIDKISTETRDQNASKMVIEAGYNLKNIVNELEDFYLSL